MANVSIEVEGLSDALYALDTNRYKKAEYRAIRGLTYDARDIARAEVRGLYNVKKSALNKRLVAFIWGSIATGINAMLSAKGRNLQLSDFTRSRATKTGIKAETRKGKPFNLPGASFLRGRSSGKKVAVWFRGSHSRGPRGGKTKTVGTVSVGVMFDNDRVLGAIRGHLRDNTLPRFQEEYAKL